MIAAVGSSPKAAGTPVLFKKSGTSVRLEKVSLNSGGYNEAWLQALAFEHPQILPIGEIEPGFGELCAVAREVPCGHGIIDNLYVTAAGDLVLVEAKLWRNPRARREVVGQVLDYVAALMGLSYEAFEDACRKGQGMAAANLYGLVAGQPEAPTEPAFIDAVSRNLGFGRVLAIVLGDGIRSETEALAELVQSHAGAHFTFALVELASWCNPDTGDLIALPSTLARTAMITRGIVAVEQGTPTLKAVPVAAAKPTTISEELYYEALSAKDPMLPSVVKAFVASLDDLDVFPDLKASLNLKADLPGATKATNFGYITKAGKLWTDPLGWAPTVELAPAFRQIAEAYNAKLAAVIGGSVARHQTSGHSYLSSNGAAAPLVSVLLPQHADAWLQAIGEAADAIRMAYSQAEVDG